MSNIKDISDIVTNQKKKLQGFKILGVFPFYSQPTNVKTHVQLCRIKNELQKIKTDEIKISDFSNYKLQSKIYPLILEYCLLALLNDRNLSFLYKPILKHKLSKSTYKQLCDLFNHFIKLNEPAFFFSIWNYLMLKNDTILKVEKPSLEK